jgi:hypothetical protein
MKKNEMGRACGICERQEGCTQDFGGEFRRQRDHLENLVKDGRIVLTGTFKKCDGWRGHIDWIDLTQDRDRWRALVNAVMNLQFP